MTVLGFDYGKKYVGVAIGSTETGIAEPLQTFTNSHRLFLDISSLVTTHHPSRLIIGVSERESARLASLFAERLNNETSLPTELVDETLSTQEAFALTLHKRRLVKKQTLHAAAAAVILDRWFADHN